MFDPTATLQRLLAIDTTKMGNEVLRRHRRRIERIAASCGLGELIVSSATASSGGVLQTGGVTLPREPLAAG